MPGALGLKEKWARSRPTKLRNRELHGGIHFKCSTTGYPIKKYICCYGLGMSIQKANNVAGPTRSAKAEDVAKENLAICRDLIEAS